MKRILVLGAGMVSRPGVTYLLDRPDYTVTVAEKIVARAEHLVAGRANGRAVAFDVEDNAALHRLVSEHDVVISILPWTFHLRVARACVEIGRHMVTTSYVSEGMKALAPEIERKGLIFLNEIGVDPGIDHMTAKQIIDRIHGEGGRIIEFRSICGGLPAPADNDNPFGYKFSWSPRGVLLASRNSARFLENGRLIEIPGDQLFDTGWTETVAGIGELEIYANRDSLGYRELYEIPEVQTLLRGTYRYPGWRRTLKAIGLLELISDRPVDRQLTPTWSRLLETILEVPAGSDLTAAVCRRTGLDSSAPEIDRLRWLGLFETRPLPDGATCLDLLCELMQEKLRYREGERDMLLMRHTFLVENRQGQRERIVSTLIDYGIPGGDSAMARTVSLPMAIATCMIADGRVQCQGVVIPTRAEIYDPVLDELEKTGIAMEEERSGA